MASVGACEGAAWGLSVKRIDHDYDYDHDEERRDESLSEDHGEYEAGVLRPNHYRFFVRVPESSVRACGAPASCDVLVEARHVIAGSGASYNVGTALAYLMRAGKKAGSGYQEDVRKAIRHLEFELEGIVTTDSADRHR